MRLIAALVLATPAAAQNWPVPWDGYWRAPNQTCEQATRYDGALTSDETRCEGVSAQALATPSAWEIVMRCDDEGRVWTDSRIVLLEDRRLWVWFGPGGLGPQELIRCKSSGEY